MGATLWFVLVAAGFGLIAIVEKAKHSTLKAVLVRVAAFAFIGAGTIGATGWIGDLMDGTVSWVNDTARDMGVSAIGTGAVWVVWLSLAIGWLLCILPESWFSGDIPDWLSVSGVLLPGLAASIPGPIGDFFQRLFTTIGDLMVTGVSNLIGVS